MKKCNRCGITKLLEAFYSDKKCKYGVSSTCKDCMKLSAKIWRDNNKQKKDDYQKKYRETHREYFREYFKEYKKEIKYKESKKNYRKTKNGRKQKRLEFKRYLNKYPHKKKEYELTRKYRERGAIGQYSEQDWIDIKKFYGNKCLSCGLSEPEIELTRDHVIPVTKNGSNMIENIQPLCRRCNSIKGVKIIDYRRRRTPLALDGANAPDFQQSFPADVLVGEGTLPEPPRR